MQKKILTLDRIEGSIAVFELSDTDKESALIELPLSWFSNIQEGDQFDLTLNTSISIVPKLKQETAKTEAEERLDRLRSRDSGEQIIDL